MAVSRYVSLDRLGSSYRNQFTLFASTDTGKYTVKVDDEDGQVLVENSTSTLQVIAASRLTSNYASAWSYGGGNATTYNYGGFTTTYSSTSTSYRIGPSSRSSSTSGACYVDVVDEYGTHYGTQSGTNLRFPSNQFIGVMHATTTDSTKVFKGWKITCGNAQAIEIKVGDLTTTNSKHSVVSYGGVQTGNVIEFGNGYADAVCIHTYANSQSAYKLTIEAVYGTLTQATFVSAEGTQNVPSPISCEIGDTIQIPATIPVLTDYTFDGWLCNIDGQIYQPGDSYLVTNGGIIFTAQWSGGPTPPPTPSSGDAISYNPSSGSLSYNPVSGSLVYS